MRKNFDTKHLTYPQPVYILAAYSEDGAPCAMNAAWGGISGAKEISLCIGIRHKTTKNILHSGAFTVSIADEANMVACDYVGIVSGNDEPDKFAKAGFHATKSEFVNAPIIDELLMTLECKLTSYDEKTGHLIGEIINVSADESIINEEGKVDPQKLRPISFDPMNHTYLATGEKVGEAFKDGLKLK